MSIIVVILYAYFMEVSVVKVSVFLLDGFETVECLAVVDVLRHANIEVKMFSLTGNEYVTSAQNVIIKADALYDEDIAKDADALFLPGGPRTANYEKHPEFLNMVKEAFESGKLVTAICAAPSILGHLDILQGKKATCFPGFEKDLYGATFVGEKVVADGNVITGKGMGASIDMGLAIVEYLVGEDVAMKIAKGTQFILE